MRAPGAVPNLCKAASDSGLSAMIGILVAISHGDTTETHPTSPPPPSFTFGDDPWHGTPHENRECGSQKAAIL